MTKSLDRKEPADIPNNKELHVIHQNIHLFERFFGFKFFDNHSIRLINNQSYVTLDRIYPEISSLVEEENHSLLNEKQKTEEATISSIHRQKQMRDKGFKVLSEPSTILTPAQSFMVD